MTDIVKGMWENYCVSFVPDDTPLLQRFFLQHSYYTAVSDSIKKIVLEIEAISQNVDQLEVCIDITLECNAFFAKALEIRKDLDSGIEIVSNNNAILNQHGSAINNSSTPAQFGGLILSEEEHKLVLNHRKQQAREAISEICSRCKGERVVFSGLYGHPETSDGGPIMERCGICNGAGRVFK